MICLITNRANATLVGRFETPAIPREGEMLVFKGVKYIVIEVVWVVQSNGLAQAELNVSRERD